MVRLLYTADIYSSSSQEKKEIEVGVPFVCLSEYSFFF